MASIFWGELDKTFEIFLNHFLWHFLKVQTFIKKKSLFQDEIQTVLASNYPLFSDSFFSNGFEKKSETTRQIQQSKLNLFYLKTNNSNLQIGFFKILKIFSFFFIILKIQIISKNQTKLVSYSFVIQIP